MPKKKIVVEEVLDEKAPEAETPKPEEKETSPSILDPEPVEKPAETIPEPIASESSPAPTEEAVEVPLEKTNKKLYTWGIVSGIIIFLLVGAVFYLAIRLNQETKNKKEVMVEATASPEATSQAITQLTKNEITLEVLNGSGVSGKATLIADQFTELGYTVSKVGNAPSAAQTTLLAGTGLTEKLQVLLADVEKELKVSSVSGEFSDSTASARIILGSK